MDVALFIVSLFLFPDLSQQAGCDRGWFGSKCQFMCRCTNNNCDTMGLCTRGEHCLAGWFGPACQYEDIAYYKSNLTEVTDGDDGTCVDSVTVRRIFISLKYPLMWMRVHFSMPGVMDKLKVNMWGSKNTKMCTVPRHTSVDNRTLDINCIRTSYVYSIVLYGIGAHYVCSAYVTGGRNVAIKQKVRLSSTYSERSTKTGNKNWDFSAELAVDGDRSQNLYQGGRCAMTRGDPRNRGALTLWLSPPCVVNKYFVYNRVDASSQRLKGFTVESFNASGSLVYRRKDEKTYFVRVYDYTTGDRFVALINVTENNPEKVLHVCELEVYGEYLCPAGRYGLECEKTCNCLIQDTCFVSTGGCPSGCAGGYHGGDCSTPCAADTYGPNCIYPCSSHCCKPTNDFETTCNPVNGTCLFDCEIGFDGFTSDAPCTADTFGPNCISPCSPNCYKATNDSETICSPVNGTCLFGCEMGFEGFTCDDPCGLNTYGENCQMTCSNECLNSSDSGNSSCDHINGVCINGCFSGYTGDLCTETCRPNTYGENCHSHCSSGCLHPNVSSDSPCDYISGECLYGCVGGYNGTLCMTKIILGGGASTLYDITNKRLIIVITSVLVAGAMVAICTVFIITRKRRHASEEEESQPRNVSDEGSNRSVDTREGGSNRSVDTREGGSYHQEPRQN